MRKIQKTDPRTSRRKGPTHIRPTSPVCASTGAEDHGSAVGGEPARKAHVAPRVRSRTEGARSGPGDEVRRRKNSGFSPRFRQISAGFIVKQE